MWRMPLFLSCCKCLYLSSYTLFFAGIALGVGFPVLHLRVLNTVLAVHLAVVVNLGQTPADTIVAWDGQCVLDEECLCLCKCFVTLIHVVGDCVCCVYHLGEFLVGIQQVFVCRGFFGKVVDIVVGDAVVSVVIAIPLLAQIVLRVTVVCAPTVDKEGMAMCLSNFFSKAGYIGLDVQLDIVILYRF